MTVSRSKIAMLLNKKEKLQIQKNPKTESAQSRPPLFRQAWKIVRKVRQRKVSKYKIAKSLKWSLPFISSIAAFVQSIMQGGYVE
jgi:hypothetical protein